MLCWRNWTIVIINTCICEFNYLDVCSIILKDLERFGDLTSQHPTSKFNNEFLKT
jgi:hypothetical protein